MTNKDFIEIINKAERNFPVNELKYNDLNCWPIIRLVIFKGFYSSKQIAQKPSSFRAILSLFLKTMIHNLFHSPKSADIIFFCKSTQRVKQGNFSFHKFADSFQAFLPADISFAFWEYSTISENIKNPKSSSIFWLAPSYYKLQFLSKIKSLFPQKGFEINELDTFINYFNEEQSIFTLDKEIILNHLKRVLAYSKMFEEKLRKHRPKFCLIHCFYSEDTLGFSLACEQLKIKSVEYQHGQQGDFHIMYTHWAKPPKKGYKLIPKYFWTWGQISHQRIKNWTKNTAYHQAFIGGNTWLAYHAQKARKNEILKLSKAQKKKVVLISMQYNDIPDFLIEAINQSKEIRWLFRLHPRFLFEKEKVRKNLSDKINDPKKFEIDRASEEDFYSLIKTIDYQLTFWSTVAYEALAFDVPTIIIHPNGKQAMREYIQKSIFGYADSCESLLTALEKKDYKKETIPYIETSQKVFTERVLELLKNKEN